MKSYIILFFSVFFFSLSYQAQTVYLTKTGSKYHTDSCKYLGENSFTISLSEAMAQNYKECGACSPSKGLNSISKTNANNSTPPNIDTVSSTGVYNIVEKTPEFTGGTSAMFNFIARNLQYPPSAREAGLGGKCFIKFVVKENGEIGDIVVLKGVPKCPQCDAEAIRVIRAMPIWQPAVMHNKPVKAYFNLPFSFKAD